MNTPCIHLFSMAYGLIFGILDQLACLLSNPLHTLESHSYENTLSRWMTYFDILIQTLTTAYINPIALPFRR